MKQKRIVVKGVGVYHVFNRTAYSLYTLSDTEREVFVAMMQKQAFFCGVDVLAYCVLSNHFHLLLRVPNDKPISDEVLLERYRRLYTDDPAPKAAMRPSDLQKVLAENDDYAAQVRQALTARMHRLSVFMKELQQRFGIWYNRTHGNKGTLWSERFRSVFVQRDPRIMCIVAAYIELNPVRAGIVERPDEYQWCSLAAAIAGDQAARQGIQTVSGYNNNYKLAFLAYTRGIYPDRDSSGDGMESDRGTQDAASNELTIYSALRSRVAMFTRGVVLGTTHFVARFATKWAPLFGLRPRKQDQEHEKPMFQGKDFCALRDRHQ